MTNRKHGTERIPTTNHIYQLLCTFLGLKGLRDWKVSELESVRMHFSLKLESVRIGKCQNWKVSEFSDSLNIGENDAWVTIMVQTMSLETSIGTCHTLKLLLKHNLAHI